MTLDHDTPTYPTTVRRPLPDDEFVVEAAETSRGWFEVYRRHLGDDYSLALVSCRHEADVVIRAWKALGNPSPAEWNPSADLAVENALIEYRDAGSPECDR